MQIERILFPITSLGPGERLVLWTLGCKKHCKKCANPELRSFNSKKNITLSQFKSIMKNIELKRIDGVTVTGGEPLLQARELLEFIEYFKTFTKDILIFTGFSEDEIRLSDDYVHKCVEESAIIVAGEYIDELNDNTTPLIASSNQKIIWGNDVLITKYTEYMKIGRQIQNIYYNDNLISVGIHNRRNEND